MNTIKLMSLDRNGITDLEREMFLKDLGRVTGEYFETEGETALEVTRTEKGFVVCVIFSARRIKTVMRPA